MGKTVLRQGVAPFFAGMALVLVVEVLLVLLDGAAYGHFTERLVHLGLALLNTQLLCVVTLIASLRLSKAEPGGWERYRCRLLLLLGAISTLSIEALVATPFIGTPNAWLDFGLSLVAFVIALVYMRRRFAAAAEAKSADGGRR